MTRRSLLVAVLLVAAACHRSDPNRRQRIISEEVGRLRPADVSLTAYGTYELKPVNMSAEVGAQPEKVAVAGQFRQTLEARLNPMLADWTARANPANRGRTLIIQPTVVALRIVSGAARFWVGAMAGDSTIDVDLTLIDKEANREIARVRIAKSTGGMAGAWSFGASDRNLIEYAADITQGYLIANYR